MGLTRVLSGTPLALQITSSSGSFDYTWIMALDEPETPESLSSVDNNTVLMYLPIESAGTLSPMVEFNLPILFPGYNNAFPYGEYTPIETYQYASYGDVGQKVVGSYTIDSMPFYGIPIDGSPNHVSLGNYIVEFEFSINRAEGVHLYQLSYDGNGATAGTPPSGDNVPAGVENGIRDNSELTRTGYVFAGWNIESDGSGTTYAGGDMFEMPEHDVLLYAMWSPV